VFSQQETDFDISEESGFVERSTSRAWGCPKYEGIAQKCARLQQLLGLPDEAMWKTMQVQDKRQASTMR
jgi:hypothetical protein